MDAFFELIDGDVTFNEGIVMNIPFVRKIIRRDRGGVIEGDSDGRKKLMAKAEILYVWYMVNATSPVIAAGLSGNEAKNRAKLECGLPTEWNADELIEEFIQYYGKYHDTSIVKAMKQILRGFKMLEKTNDILLNNIDSKLQENELTTEQLADLNKAQKEILTSCNDIPKLVDNFTKLRETFNDQDNSFGVMLGGGEIEESMIPGR